MGNGVFGSIRRRLIILVLLVALPLVGATLLVVQEVADAQRLAQLNAITGSTRALAAAVDSELNRHLAVATALTASQALRDGDLAQFRLRAIDALKFLPNSWLILLTPDGTPLINTQRPFGTALPKVPPDHPHFTVMKTRTYLISDMLRGQVMGRYVAGVFVPVLRDGVPIYDIVVVVNPENFLEILHDQRFGPGWVAGIIDRKGNFVARSTRHESEVGQPASAAWRAAFVKGMEGFYDGPAIEGNPIIGAYVNSPLSGWSVSIAISKEVLSASANHSLRLIGATSLGLIVLSITLALWASRRIAEPMHSLESAAAALMRGERARTTRTGLREVDSALEAFDATAVALLERERRQRLMVNELNHRVKNTLSVIQSIATLTARSAATVRDFSRSFTSRLIGISRTHDLLTESHWSGALIRDVVGNELGPYESDDGARITRNGDPVHLTPKVAMALGMVLHELTTNAAKYGALSVPEGRLDVAWSLSGAGDTARLRLTWTESGGPEAHPPDREGFGSLLIAGNIRDELGGTLDLHYRPGGLVCVIDIPLASPGDTAEQAFATS